MGFDAMIEAALGAAGLSMRIRSEAAGAAHEIGPAG